MNLGANLSKAEVEEEYSCSSHTICNYRVTCKKFGSKYLNIVIGISRDIRCAKSMTIAEWNKNCSEILRSMVQALAGC